MSLLNNVLGSLNPFSWLRGRQRSDDVFESVTELQDEDEEPSTFSDAVEDASVGTESSCNGNLQHELATVGPETAPQQMNADGHEMQLDLSEEFTLVGNAKGEKPLLRSKMDDPLSLSSGDNENQHVACSSVGADIGRGETGQSKTPEPMDEMLDANVAITADTEKSEEMHSQITNDTTPSKVRRKLANVESRKSQDEGQNIISCAVGKLYGASDPPDIRGVAWKPPFVHGAVAETSAMSTGSAKKRKAGNDLTADDEEIRFVCEEPCAKQLKKIKKLKRSSVTTSAQSSSSRSNDMILCGAGTPLNTPVIVHCPRAKIVATVKEPNSQF
ncbi:unnamed protein product [Cylicocyclus nassatus]|uniref:Uncharacterized protein n=1 Tax=Cylicocyclus nassatus TaxID=53992 RepID=A0AA36DPK9_CYLNA|nr:unnamed protein product [Cylicocyclus nassatus]